MIPTSTERPLSRTQVAKYRKSDPTIYLRTYDVIKSLDRAQNTPWWERVLISVNRLRQSSQKPAKRHLALPAAGVPMLALPPPAEQFSPAPVDTAELTGAPVAAPLAARTPERQLTLMQAATSKAFVESAANLITPFGEGRKVSLVFLAVVAMVTAGLTFAVIHFAWPSVEAGSGWPHHKHVSGFVTTRSEVLPQLFLRLKTIWQA